MADETNPVTTPSGQPPAQASDGTLINQAATQPTVKDSSTTEVNPNPETPPKTPTEPSTKPDPTKTALNKDGKLEAPAGAPDKYTDFKLPDGVTFQPELLTEAQTTFKSLGLSQDQAQTLIDLNAKQIKSLTEAPYNAVAETKSKWEGELKSTYGKDIEAGGKVITSISRMIDTLPPVMASGFREAMDLTLAGSNPAFVAAFYELSQRLGEGKSVAGKGPSPMGQSAPDAKPKSVAEALYPHLPSANRQS